MIAADEVGEREPVVSATIMLTSARQFALG
jgi:hypothetical protein